MANVATDQSFSGHVQELRRRITWTILALILGAGIAFLYREQIINFLVEPLKLPLFYSSPGGNFDFVMRISLAVGVIVALPIFIYNLVRFIEPALGEKRVSRKTALFIILTSGSLSIIGMLFAFYGVLPTAFNFFADFNFGPIKPLISTTGYLSFVIGCLVTFALIFQVPLVLIIINKIRRFPPRSLSKFHRHVIVGSLVIALVMPFTYDPITQFIIALPIIVLYELSVLIIWLTNRKYYKMQKRLLLFAKQKAARQKIIDLQQQQRQQQARLEPNKPTHPPRHRLIQL